MGQEIFEDYEAGNECTHCFGESNVPIYGGGNLITPKYVQATISGVIACAGHWEDPNGVYLLTQSALCSWLFLDANWRITYNAYLLDPPNEYATLSAKSIVDGDWYFLSSDVICKTGFVNEILIGNCGGIYGGHDGSGTVSWGPGIGV